MNKYVVDLQSFSKKLRSTLINKKMVDKNGNPDPIKLHNVLYPDDMITENDIEKFGRSNFTEKTRKERNWINGANYPKTMNDVLLLCNALECDLDYFFTDMQCETHDIQFIHSRTGLSETAIKELEQLDDEANVFEDSQYDLDTINMLIAQLKSKNNSIIHWITTYIRSKGLKGNFWYYTESGTILSKRYNSVEPVIHLEEKSDTFDNLILMGLQNRIKALKTKLSQ